MRKKCKRKSGHYTPKYQERLPYHLRVKYDILEDRVMYDDWNDYRDGFRDSPWYQKYGNKPKYNLKKLKRLIPYWFEEKRMKTFLKTVEKWNKKASWRKKAKRKRENN